VVNELHISKVVDIVHLCG